MHIAHPLDKMVMARCLTDKRCLCHRIKNGKSIVTISSPFFSVSLTISFAQWNFVWCWTKWLTTVDAKYMKWTPSTKCHCLPSHSRWANRVNKCSAIWHNLPYIEWKYASFEAKYISVFWLFDTAAVVASYRRRFLSGHSSDFLDVLSIDSIDGVEAVCFGIVKDAAPSP